MTKEEKIKAIYEEIADKELSFGCRFIPNIQYGTPDKKYYLFDNHGDYLISKKDSLSIEYISELSIIKDKQTKIIGHEVMINRLEFLTNENDYLKIRNSISKDELLLPIDNWNENSINLLYKIVLTL